MEITTGPRWITVRAEEFDPRRYLASDRIRVQGHLENVQELRTQLPGLVVRPDKQEALSRRFETSQDLMTMGVQDLARRWALETHQPEPDDRTLGFLADLESRCQKTDSREGVLGISRIEKIQIINQGPHQNTVLELPDTRFLAICGQNGNGKSLLIEALHAALHGSWVTANRPFESMAWREKMPWRVRVQFRHREDCLPLEICRGKGMMTVTEMSDPPVLLKSGIKDCGAWLAPRFPRDQIRDMLIAQSGGGLVEGTDADRMTQMARILNLGVYDDLLKELEKVMVDYRQVEFQIKQAPELQGKLEYLESGMGSARQELGTVQQILEMDRAERDKVQAELRRVKALADFEAEMMVLKSWLREAETEIYSLNGDITAQENILKRMDSLSRYRDALEALAGDQNRMAEVTRLIQCLEPVTANFQQAGCREKPIPCVLIDAGSRAWGQLEKLRTERLEIQNRAQEQIQDLAPQMREIQGVLGIGPEILVQGPQALLSAWDAHGYRTAEGLKTAVRRREYLGQQWTRKEGRYDELLARMDADAGTPAGQMEKLHENARVLEGRISAALTQITFQGRQVQEWARQIEQIRCTLAETDAKSQDLERYLWIQRACSRTGIRQLLIDSAIPGLQEILDQLCGGPLEGRFWLQLRTQKFLQGGESREAFQILYRRGSAEPYDVRSCSPGELAQIRPLWMAAQLIWVQRVQSSKILLMDEPTSAQDPESQQLFLRLLRSGVQAQQIIMVTHNPEIADACDARIEIKRGD
jgi:DNA repair exonuclease SbcCD ATPase subunit